MKGKIDKDGSLWIQRGKVFRKQMCPFAGTEAFKKSCGDWCPLFDADGLSKDLEELRSEPFWDGGRWDGGRHLVLSCCKSVVVFDELTDEREASDE